MKLESKIIQHLVPRLVMVMLYFNYPICPLGVVLN
jgi:hypothetical protein